MRLTKQLSCNYKILKNGAKNSSYGGRASRLPFVN